MKTIYKKRLLKLADFLEKLPKKTFDLTDFVIPAKDDRREVLSNLRTGPEKVKDCGTTACAVGWCPYLFKKDFNWVINEHTNVIEVVNTSTKRVNFGAAEDFFGLRWDQGRYLFMPDWNYSTREDVVNRIREFVKES